ncbi:hypothetical protein AAES_170525 [Amazona aestiva]|uniref:Rho-GAP domain-containing protein n=1 Tax=Amazona aestiva TaxID=12930 RepID=A0A0Q3XB26_AMAAE|nr:hypothetical protein AAES_170525 [Amazona aestiva]
MNVATTKTTAGNLALCLPSNILSPPQELPLDVLAQEIEKVTQLIEFLIHRQEELLGEQVAGLANVGSQDPPAAQAELETAVGQARSSISLQLFQSAEQG